ncbi:MFS transporter, DHA1 family, bicyclomycin/chloramphenicol resistance protein [Cohaesibacter marisflavi]|uniref:MFS transporter, DHA1 family, bicyclomycin/chloramphenicol resistance protein n=1 Tax=Cohaesibacter marisflavi TaxID=655353 RepID=A0A1I5ESB2_9HYPH|nr:multidrug effflux MFS transporter [Cohaesibacter marisflavi]SFO14404.1 MFS transporter, DHA1 family, bicyclomycin/chloramphenicol resistance protein [Cohaesibacter marisflavi]
MTKQNGLHDAGAAANQTRSARTAHIAEPNMPFVEFIILMALLMSLAALCTDSIMPAFSIIGAEFGHSSPQELQKIITIFFAGLAIGQLIYGPLSDQIGRKSGMFIGLVIFIIGNLMSWFSTSFEMLLLGRFLQGFGVAGPRIVMIALIRDLYAGREMARIMSFVMGLFIFVPALAPISGQTIMAISGWRSVFFSFILLATIGGLWLGFRQNETLHPSRRIKVTPSNLWRGSKVIFTTPSCLGYMVAAGFVQGPFMLYLSTAQHLFQSTYGLGTLFPFAFAGLAFSVGFASFMNSRLVLRFGMRYLVRRALIAMAIIAALGLACTMPFGFVPELWMLFVIFSPLFFCTGLLFGNMNTLAMEEVGNVAGMASAWVGAVSTLIAMTIATLMGQIYDGSILALLGSFMVGSSITMLLTILTERWRERRDRENALAQ